MLSRAQGLVASTANIAALTGELLKQLADPIDEIVVKAQRAGEMREDIQTDDIPRLLVVIIAGLTVPGLPPGAHQRYLTLVFDGLKPQNATPLPPIAP